VLFIDIVGYSKLSINQQTELLEQLKGMVHGSEEARAAETEGKTHPDRDGRRDGVGLPHESGSAGAMCARTRPGRQSAS
jgi:hypothetical protein